MIALLLKASFVIAIVWIFYKLFLEKESFFAANRIYLLGGIFLAFLLPFVSLPELVNDQGFISTMIEPTETNKTSPYEYLSPQPKSGLPEKTQEEPRTQHQTPAKQQASFLEWLLWGYYFGVIVLFLNLLFQIGSLLITVRKSSDKVPDTEGIIVNTPLVQEPCSFFRYIFINPELYEYDTYEQIVSHEKIHVRQLHTLDLLLAELAIIILWFNPLIWVFRKEIEKNIEYQTDDLLLDGETVEKEQYQMNLLRIATYSKPLTITTNYNQSLIKQRILMMNAKKSNPHSYWKYAFMAPILFVILLALNKPVSVYAQNDFLEPTVLAQNEFQETKNQEKENNPLNDDCKELLQAVKEKDIAKVRELLKTVDPNCTYRGDGEPRSPLVSAARNGDLALGKLLIEAGANVEFHAQGDETPLMAASANGKLDFVQYLVANGAEINKKLQGDGTALLVASREGHLETVEYLISQGADIDAQVGGDGTALINSVRNGHYEVSKILLENGADPYLVSPGDEYPMYYARETKNKKMIGLLKKYEKEN